ncbi:fimbria/pilus periplasmic chaperone [Klebsiella aerogenes]|uniref:fimbrial biogenesis chaperone n=1 Tax=Klebsiella aerogenes TaxID=548 RepID=UPI00254A6127|nr:fimbria/pilus periplasmic chaperone [Klebsiella aerogenes]MDK6932429.1 fimbria/pilus periplasmic chaperone [Klebsiella aerogenes]
MANIVITGTRVVYPENEREVTIKIDNVGDKPALVQAWIDAGDPNIKPETAKAPFTLTPPLNRVNPGKGQTLRMMYTGDALPKDRESLFWLNVLEIPTKPQGSENRIQIAMRSRIKIFYRPKGLTGEANKAGRAVTWKKVKGGIEGTNPTPYYVSVAKISEDKAGKNMLAEGGMIAPGGRKIFAIKNLTGMIYPTYINDQGGLKSELQPVTP